MSQRSALSWRNSASSRRRPRPLVLEIGLDVERVDLAHPDLAAVEPLGQPVRRVAQRAAAAEAHDAHLRVVGHEDAARLGGVCQDAATTRPTGARPTWRPASRRAAGRHRSPARSRHGPGRSPRRRWRVARRMRIMRTARAAPRASWEPRELGSGLRGRGPVRPPRPRPAQPQRLSPVRPAEPRSLRPPSQRPVLPPSSPSLRTVVRCGLRSLVRCGLRSFVLCCFLRRLLGAGFGRGHGRRRRLGRSLAHQGGGEEAVGAVLQRRQAQVRAALQLGRRLARQHVAPHGAHRHDLELVVALEEGARSAARSRPAAPSRWRRSGRRPASPASRRRRGWPPASGTSSARSSGRSVQRPSGLRRQVPVPVQGASTSTRSKAPAWRFSHLRLSASMARRSTLCAPARRSRCAERSRRDS